MPTSPIFLLTIRPAQTPHRSPVPLRERPSTLWTVASTAQAASDYLAAYYHSPTA
ncbi:MAG: hypothetical protein WKF58_05285 [Ilumatobacteraceae bacterium]